MVAETGEGGTKGTVPVTAIAPEVPVTAGLAVSVAVMV